jgi:hypothetical protein
MDDQGHQQGEQWIVCRAVSDPKPRWLAGFVDGQPIWTAETDGAAVHDHEDSAWAAVRTCTQALNPHPGYYLAAKLNDLEQD